MFTSTDLKAIITKARPIIERQLDDAEIIASFRTKVTDDGGDWGQVKALVKAMIQDERDEAGGNKRVRALLDKADHATAYADMLGLGNLNEKNSFGDPPLDREARAKQRLSESMDDNKALSAQMLADGLISEEAHAENIAISDGVARKLGAGVIDPVTGKITNTNSVTQAAGTAGEGSDALPADTSLQKVQRTPPAAIEALTVEAGGTAVRHMGGVA